MSIRLLRHYGGRWPAWLSESVTTAGRDEAASKEVTYRLTAQCLVWLLRPVDSLL